MMDIYDLTIYDLLFIFHLSQRYLYVKEVYLCRLGFNHEKKLRGRNETKMGGCNQSPIQ